MSTVVEAAKKPMPIKKAQKTVKKAASKAKSQVKGGASGADFWYGPNRPGFLGELRVRSTVESHIHPTGCSAKAVYASGQVAHCVIGLL